MSTLSSEHSKPKTGQRRFKFCEAIRSDVGLRRSENQDAYGVAHTNSTSLYLVADGMGGARGGATASAIAIRVITEQAVKENGLITRPSLQTAIENANAEIYRRSKEEEDLSGMGTTIVALALVNECAIVAHVGDSRIYRLRRGVLSQLTHDHTLVQELVDTGAIPEEEAENHPIAHMLTRSLGPSEKVNVEIHAAEEPLEHGDRFLLCSDGLYNLVTPEEISENLEKPPETAVQALIALALERGGTDNVTASIVEARDMDDAEFVVEYPGDGTKVLNVSPGVEKVLLHHEINGKARGENESVSGLSVVEDADLPLDSAADGSDDALISLDESLIDVTQDLIEPQVEQPSRFSILRLQAAVFFVIGLGFGVLGYSLYQYRVYESRQVFSVHEQASPVNERKSTTSPSGEIVAERNQLQEELSNWAQSTAENRESEPTNPESIAKIPPENLPEQIGDESLKPSVVPGDSAPLAAELDSLALSRPPQVRIPEADAANRPDRPIIWEHETDRVARLLEELAAKREKASESATNALPGEVGVELLSEMEQREIASEKGELRERIGEVDAKLKLLELETKEQSQLQLNNTEQQLAQIERDLEAKRVELEQLQGAYKTWFDYSLQANGTKVLSVAQALSEQFVEVKEVKETYDQTSKTYFEAVNRWQEQPSRVELATEMGELGKRLQQARVALEEAVRTTIERQRIKALHSMVQIVFQRSRYELERNRLSRTTGYLKGFTVSTPQRRKELRDTYLGERQGLVQRLVTLSAKLSDEAEVRYRYQAMVRSIESS